MLFASEPAGGFFVAERELFLGQQRSVCEKVCMYRRELLGIDSCTSWDDLSASMIAESQVFWE